MLFFVGKNLLKNKDTDKNSDSSGMDETDDRSKLSCLESV